jgi:hypothetical protein
MDFATFLAIVDVLIDLDNPGPNYPILLRGRHGIGKSQLVYQIAVMKDLKVVERRISQMEEGELMGLPSVETKTTRWNPPDFIKECCEFPRLLFFDEVDRGEHQVRQSIMQIADSHAFNGWELHPKTIVMAAVNGGKHGSDYQVGMMDLAELDRWAIYDLDPSVEDWLTWSQGRVHPLMWEFINQHREHLEHLGPFQPDEIYPSRRSTVRLDSVLQRKSLYDYDSLKSNLIRIMQIASGFVGFGTASAFREFLANYDHLLKAEDIIDEGRWEETLDWGVNEYLAMNRRLSNSEILGNKLGTGQLKNLANYFMTLSSEVASDFWLHFCEGVRHSKHAESNIIAFAQARGGNGLTVSERFTEFNTGETIA